MFVLQNARLPTVTTIVAPHGYDWKEITAYIMKTHNLEISGGLGPSVGLVSPDQSHHFVHFLKVLTIALLEMKYTGSGHDEG